MASQPPASPPGPPSAALRPVSDIRATGAAWVAESELEWLCDQATELAAIQPAYGKKFAAISESLGYVGEAIRLIEDEDEIEKAVGHLQHVMEVLADG